MKLNYFRTICVGFAFFLICAFWQAYDTIVPLILVNKFGMSQSWSGFIMGRLIRGGRPAYMGAQSIGMRKSNISSFQRFES